MTRKTGMLIVALVLSAVTVGEAAAFDGKRKGFMLDFALGGGLVSDDFGPLGSDNRGGAGATLNIGYGVNEKLAIYYGGRSAAWTSSLTDDIHTLYVGGPGFTYYLEESSPSAFVSGIAGYARYGADSGSADGGGFAVEIGQEFRKNWSFSVGYALGRIEGFNTHLLMARIGHRWY